MTGDKPESSSEGGALFGFDDLQALRDEYEERLAQQKRGYEEKLKADSAARGELIHELTFELASVHEETARKQKEHEQRLAWALTELRRLELELVRVRETLAAAPGAAPAVTAPLRETDASALVVSSAPEPVAPAAPPPTPVAAGAPGSLAAAYPTPSPSLEKFAPAKKKKIRLR